MTDDAPKRPSLDRLTKKEQATYEKTITEYMNFLAASRTPADAVQQITKRVTKAGIKHYTSKKQDAFYMTNPDGTNIAVVRKGTQPISDGVHIIGAHLDSPCLTAKVHPIREKPEGVAIDCYPYGGIYPHQWFDTMVDVLGHCIKDGKQIDFTLPGIITDATIHLSAADRMQKKYEDAFDSESLDVFIGFRSKKVFLEYMKSEYGLSEDDFARSMLTIVPQTTPRKVSDLYLAGFGQDDKICAYAQMDALLQAKPEKTAITLFFDREEIGSTGYNGANSRFLEQVMDAVATNEGVELTDVMLRKVFAQSLMISADVDVAYSSHDTAYSQEESASKFGHGIIMDRNNGGRNQVMGNNVPMSLVDRYMSFFKKQKVEFRVSAIPPKVNVGGGGTIAMYFAHRGIPVADMGIAVTNMHGKHSVCFLPDFYQMVKGFKAFLSSTL